MGKDKAESAVIDWREFDKAMEALHKAWEDALKVWRDYRRLLKEASKKEFGAQKPRL